MLQNTEILAIAILVGFAVVAAIVFRERRWQGAVGWILIAGGFIFSVLRRGDSSLVSSVMSAMVILIGIGFAGYDYSRFERPRRRQRRAASAASGRQSLMQRVRARRRFRRRSEHHDDR